jgi:hypothetical protein
MAAEQLVKALRSLPVEELRAQMPELDQLLSQVRHQGGHGPFGGGMHQAQAANALQQLSRAGGNGGMEGNDSHFRSSGGFAAFSAGQGLGGAAGARSAGVHGGGAGRSADDEEFGAAVSLLSAQRSAPARRGGRGGHASNKLPLVQGAELEAYAARGPLTVMVGRNGETMQALRGRGNWRRGMTVSNVVRT